MSDIKYKRVLLKLSGEALAGENKTGLSAEVVDKIKNWNTWSWRNCSSDGENSSWNEGCGELRSGSQKL